MSIASKLSSIEASKEAIRQALIGKGVACAESVPLDEYAEKVETLLSGTGTADGTAAAGDMLAGKTAYVNGSKITGTIISQNAATITPTTEDQVISAGKYLEGAQTVKGDINLTPGNIKAGRSIFGVVGNLIASGIDTSDANAGAGDILTGKTAYVNGSKVTGTIPAQAGQLITPGTTDQTIAAGQYLTGAQTIKGDAKLIAGNIKKDVTIFGVTGTYEGIDTSDATATADDIASGKTAYVNGVKITGTHA